MTRREKRNTLEIALSLTIFGVTVLLGIAYRAGAISYQQFTTVAFSNLAACGVMVILAAL